MRQGAKSSGHRSRGPTTRSPRGTLELPRIATRWPDEVIAHVLVPIVGRIGFAKHNAPGSFDARRDHAVKIGDVVLKEFGAIGTAQTNTGFEIFDRDGEPMQGLEGLTTHHGGLSRLRLLSGALGVYRQIGIETRIQDFNTS